MSLESKSADQLSKYNDAANEEMTEELKSALKGYAIAGAIVWCLPFHGAECVIYAVVLWLMYYKLTGLADRKFGISSIIGGMFINVMICLVLNMVLDILNYFLGIGFIIGAISGYVATYLSGKTYIGYLVKNQ